MRCLMNDKSVKNEPIIFTDMLHDMFVCQSGLRRVLGTINVTLALQDPQQGSTTGGTGTQVKFQVKFFTGVYYRFL